MLCLFRFESDCEDLRKKVSGNILVAWTLQPISICILKTALNAPADYGQAHLSDTAMAAEQLPPLRKQWS